MLRKQRPQFRDGEAFWQAALGGARKTTHNDATTGCPAGCGQPQDMEQGGGAHWGSRRSPSPTQRREDLRRGQVGAADGLSPRVASGAEARTCNERSCVGHKHSARKGRYTRRFRVRAKMLALPLLTHTVPGEPPVPIWSRKGRKHTASLRGCDRQRFKKIPTVSSKQLLEPVIEFMKVAGY